MFVSFDSEHNRLNTGVRGRLQDRVLELMDKRKVKGFDANYIYENTRKLEHEGGHESKKHTLNFMARLYLEKIKYFV